jgi:hypothetical protein
MAMTSKFQEWESLKSYKGEIRNDDAKRLKVPGGWLYSKWRSHGLMGEWTFDDEVVTFIPKFKTNLRRLSKAHFVAEPVTLMELDWKGLPISYTSRVAVPAGWLGEGVPEGWVYHVFSINEKDTLLHSQVFVPRPTPKKKRRLVIRKGKKL